jgi:hypothetical protein
MKDHQRVIGVFAWSSILAGALTLAACSSSSGGDTGGVPKDGGGTGGDGGPGDGASDGSATDGGRTDSGARRDGSVGDGGPGMDAMAPDTGVDPMMNAEGHSCTPGMTAQGSCTEMMDNCVTWTPANATTQVSTCIRPCMADMDCMGSPVGNVCGNIAFNLGNFTDIKACVSAAINTEGSVGTASLLHTDAQGMPIPMTGCAEGLTAMLKGFGSLLLDLEDDQFSCVKRCAMDVDCGTGAPVCTGGVYTSTLAAATKQGICTKRKAGKGARCSERKGTEICDTSVSTGFVCLDLGSYDADNMAAMAQGDLYGVCLEICDMMFPCTARADANLTPACKFGFFTSPTLGLCSDGCSAFPDNCMGNGSPPAMGDMARGASCVQFRGMGTVDMPDQSLCLDVDQSGTLFTALTDFMQLPAVNCDTNAASCPDKTVCIGLGDPQQHTACVYGCNTRTATTGCRGTMTSTCQAVFGMTAVSGVCSR